MAFISTGMRLHTAIESMEKTSFPTLGELSTQSVGDIDAPNRYGETDLHAAALIGDLAAVRSLVERGANINAVENKSYTPLHLAAAKGHMEIVQFLASKRGIKIEAKDQWGRTALQVAELKKKTQVVSALARRGPKQHRRTLLPLYSKDTRESFQPTLVRNFEPTLDIPRKALKSQETGSTKSVLLTIGAGVVFLILLCLLMFLIKNPSILAR